MEGNKNNRVVQPLQNDPKPEQDNTQNAYQPSSQQNDNSKPETEGKVQAPMVGQASFGPSAGKADVGSSDVNMNGQNKSVHDDSVTTKPAGADQVFEPNQPGGNTTSAQTPPSNQASSPVFSGGAPQTAPGSSTDMSSSSASGATMARPATNELKHKTYLIEYLLYLIITGILLGIAVSFFTGIVNSIGSYEQSFWRAETVYNNSLIQISSALVLAVFAWVLGSRCYTTESSSPAVKQHKWRKAFLAIFIVLVSLSALGATVAFVGGIATLIGGIGLEGADPSDAVRGLSIGLFSALLLWGTVLLYGNDYLNKRVAGGLSLARRYGLLGLVVVLALAYMLFPLQKERDAIDGNSQQNRGLPESLEDRDSDWEDEWSGEQDDRWNNESTTEEERELFDQEDDMEGEWMDDFDEDMWN